MIDFFYRTIWCISLFGTVNFSLFLFEKPIMQDCNKYRTGKFYIYNKQNKQKVNIERRDSLQIETNASGDITVLKVKWTGDCDYELLFNYMTPKEISKTAGNGIFEAEGAIVPLRIKILSGTDDYYVFEASKVGFKNLKDTVWLVKENARAFTP
jgi:nitrous oxidase accessory protein NosD